jgi:hypothetical protein
MIDEMANELVSNVETTARHMQDEPEVLYFARATRAAIRTAQVIASKRALSKGYIESGFLRLYDEGVFSERFSAPVLIAGAVASGGVGFLIAHLFSG